MASLSKKNHNPEEYLLDTLNNLDIGFVKVSNNGIILNHNLTFNKIFGYDPEKNLIGTKILDYWLNSEEWNKLREVLYKNGIVKKLVVPAKKVDGKKIFLELNFKLNQNSKGVIISSEGTFTDVTVRIETEQKLKESKHALGKRVKELNCLYEISKLVENPVISIGNIINGTLNLIPPAWQFPSVTCARIIYDGLESKTLNFNVTEWKLDFQIQISDKVLKIEVVYLKNKPFLREEYDLLRDIGTKLKSFIERKEADKVLEEKDHLARIFMENISGFVVLLRPSTREIIVMNKYAEDMGGIPGLTCYGTIGQSKTPCPWCLAPKLWKTRAAQHLVVDALDVIWDTYWDPISDDLYLHYGFDVTEQAQREKNLKELNQIKSQFLRRASHELKTPLVSIKGFTDLLLELKTEEFEIKALSVAQEIKDGCLRLENLVNDIIYTSKLEDSQIQLSKSHENLSELIQSAVNTLKGFSQARKQKILFELPEEMFTMVNKEGIHDVLTNLISNAIKYTPKNGSIKLKAKTNEGYFVIMIEDNGIGFTPEEEKKIFTQFGKIERYGQGFDVVSEGSGLGLYITKKILTHHKGSIWLESEGRNKGTTFFFSLPIIKE
ncbi:MAG TPA: PAS domain-containing sensor histidine kinase [archaeon]|nr:PAS domain-containing sensor histidine kinase [archaeon]